MRALITTDAVGGVWRYTQELAAGLLAQGDSVALISFGSQASTEQRAECAALADSWGPAFHYSASNLPLEWMQNNEHCLDEGAAVITTVLQEFGAELFHSNQFCFGALDLGIPKMLTAHSDVLSWARVCQGREPAYSPWIAKYRSLVQRGLDGADAVTAPTRWMLGALGEGFDVRGEVRAIPNGIDLPPAPAAAARRLQAVTAGRLWDEGKDVAVLADVHSPMPLLAAGEAIGDSAHFSFSGGIRALGSLHRGELLELFRRSAIYLCTSRYEPFGLAPLEAALCGCAVVAREIESLREVWGDGALYFRDAEDLSELLAWLFADGESLGKARERSTARARGYTRGAMVRSYRELYSAVMEKTSVW